MCLERTIILAGLFDYADKFMNELKKQKRFGVQRLKLSQAVARDMTLDNKSDVRLLRSLLH